MKFSDNAMSAILLCSYVGIEGDEGLKPLSLGEWNSLQEALLQSGKETGALLANLLEILQDGGFDEQFTGRIQNLLTRGNAAFALDDLLKKGIGIITQFDAEYPKLLKLKLKNKKPPVLFYAGDIQLANKVGIAIVGSRNVDQDGMDFTRKLAEKASTEKLVIYSGGAKGVDMISEQAAIHAGGAAVEFLADSLLARIKKKDVLEHIMRRKLLLFTDVKPELGFTAPRAMNRNKYIYASSYGAFVVSSDYNKGGTWTGATEAIRNSWTKVLVWNHREYGGNQKLLEKGGVAYELTDDKLYDVITKKEEKFEQMEMFRVDQQSTAENTEQHDEASVQAMHTNGATQDLYDYVKSYIVEHFDHEKNLGAASDYFHVAKGQMKAWLERLCEEGQMQCNKGVYMVVKKP